MKLRSLLLIALTLVLSIVYSQPALAHELEENNGVSAVLHIAPDDNPQTGQDTLMYFDFTGQQPSFDLRYCNCRISVQTSDDRQLTASIESENNSSTSGRASIRFGTPGVYDVVVRGFTSSKLTTQFKLDYRIRVTAATDPQTAANRKTAGTQIILLGLTGLVLLGVIASSAIRRGGKYSKASKQR